MPHVLDPGRHAMPNHDEVPAEDFEGHAKALHRELTRTCEYGQDLWNTLTAVREYLVDSLPSLPSTDGAREFSSARPTGAHDDEGWQRWGTVYAVVTSILAGAHGDSGFGAEEAAVIVNHRR